jgi:hypothetical protein
MRNAGVKNATPHKQCVGSKDVNDGTMRASLAEFLPVPIPTRRAVTFVTWAFPALATSPNLAKHVTNQAAEPGRD